jgi:glycogen operon protein
VRFAAWSGAAERIWVSLFNQQGDRETDRLELTPEGEGVFALFVGGLGEGERYGLRADGPYAPEKGLWFDPDKLLVDPYAVEIDRPYVYHTRLTASKRGVDTAALVPKAVVRECLPEAVAAPPLFQPGGLIYEVSVRAFTMRHPDIPAHDRGTLRALAHPVVIDHLARLGVSAVELMPITAWIDERHLPPLGLANGWGYNPVTFMALDPRLAPGGLTDLWHAVAALHGAGIGVILDLVFNHTGESDALGTSLSLRGLDSGAYYRHAADGQLVNDTGTGNTANCQHAIVQELVLDSLRHFVREAGVDGFRFDLASVLGRLDSGFDADAPLLRAIRSDALLGSRVLIAEPWDIGPGGYQLGNFQPPFLEWNDRYRDDVRRFWRGDAGKLGALATRLAGSSDVFAKAGASESRTVNFIAAHDGMTLADLVSYRQKHNVANGEGNRDGHDDNLSWNNGVEGEATDPEVKLRRKADVRALLATLFASHGTIMLTAGDEFGRSQKGNNNAYAQDNDLTWLDWPGRDTEMERYVGALSRLRRSVPALSETSFLTGRPVGADVPDVEWLTEAGTPMQEHEWREGRRLAIVLAGANADGGRLAVVVNGDDQPSTFVLPGRNGFSWAAALEGGAAVDSQPLAGRSVAFMIERKDVSDDE